MNHALTLKRLVQIVCFGSLSLSLSLFLRHSYTCYLIQMLYCAYLPLLTLEYVNFKLTFAHIFIRRKAVQQVSADDINNYKCVDFIV